MVVKSHIKPSLFMSYLIHAIRHLGLLDLVINGHDLSCKCTFFSVPTRLQAQMLAVLCLFFLVREDLISVYICFHRHYIWSRMKAFQPTPSVRDLILILNTDSFVSWWSRTQFSRPACLNLVCEDKEKLANHYTRKWKLLI